MARAILGDGKSSRRRWIIAVVIISMLVSILAASSHYHLRRSRVLAFPLPHSDLGHAKTIDIKEFVKPKGVKIVGLVFYGRRNRVEMLRCYLEVITDPQHHFIATHTNLNTAQSGRQRRLA